MMRYSILVSLLTLLTACSGIQGLESRLSPNPELQQNSENPQTSTTQLPKDFPSEIPQYPQVTIQEITQPITPQTGSIRWESAASPNEIEDFYRQQLESRQWEIIQPFSADAQDNSLIAQKDDLKIRVSLFPQNSTTEFTLDYKPVNETQAQGNLTDQTTITTRENTNFSDLEQVAEPLRPYIQELAELGILTPKNNDQFQPNDSITRREYARWLVTAKNRFSQNSPEQQIRLGLKNSQPVFSDVPPSDPDFPIIQGLAEAGFIPSRLTGDSNASLFRPDAPLTRSDLLIWKVPLDTGKSLPKASIDGIKETWGFQDTSDIDPLGLRALYADFQNGEQGNVRRVFGYTTLFQPKKPVTRAQAAAALWYFGYQGDGLSAEEVLQQTANSQ